MLFYKFFAGVLFVLAGTLSYLASRNVVYGLFELWLDSPLFLVSVMFFLGGVDIWKQSKADAPAT